jgi:hypothetical protein
MTKSKTSESTAFAQTNHSAPGYAAVNGLNMYYEIHSSGEPLVMLHGGMSTIGAFYRILPALAKSRRSGHVSYLLEQPDVLLSKLTTFLDVPMPEIEAK